MQHSLYRASQSCRINAEQRVGRSASNMKLCIIVWVVFTLFTLKTRGEQERNLSFTTNSFENNNNLSLFNVSSEERQSTDWMAGEGQGLRRGNESDAFVSVLEDLDPANGLLENASMTADLLGNLSLISVNTTTDTPTTATKKNKWIVLILATVYLVAIVALTFDIRARSFYQTSPGPEGRKPVFGNCMTSAISGFVCTVMFLSVTDVVCIYWGSLVALMNVVPVTYP